LREWKVQVKKSTSTQFTTSTKSYHDHAKKKGRVESVERIKTAPEREGQPGE